LASGDGPAVIQLSTKRIGITVKANRAHWREIGVLSDDVRGDGARDSP
jgi:hypothetical protein